ncbi:MAG TPA: lytic transglycosylase domain-containing protein, partial [Gammaproteobacteria bacterium]|nr:lytic transglycosylase domain-containing protein [Gammaproteobacteria bacterium]
GLMQLMPETAAMLGVDDPFDPEQNIAGGVRYLRMMLDEFDQNKKLALAAYNAGPQAVHKYGDSIPPYRETRNYVRKIMKLLD